MKGKLFHEICDLKTLWQAWNKVKKKGSRGGIDGVSIEEFEKSLERNLKGIKQSLERGTYVPEPASRLYVSKDKPDERRALAMPVIREKVIQEATKSVIEPLFNRAFLDFSYAYRPEKGPRRAIARVEHYLEQKKVWAGTSDIDDFFDSMNHELLLNFISKKLWEEEILRLLELWLKMGVVYKGRWIDVEEGVLQGNVISPLLSNIYLHSFDMEMKKKGFTLVRYADNFVFLERAQDEASKGLVEARAFLETQLMLRLNPDSYSVRNMHQGFVFLGFLLQANRKTIAPAKLEKIQSKIRGITSDSKGLSECVNTLNDSIQGWRNYYEIGDTKEQFQFLENYLFNELKRFLVKVKVRGRLKERQMKEVLQRLEYFIPKSSREAQRFISLLIAASRTEKTEKTKPKLVPASVEKSVVAKKREYEKILAEETDMLVSTPGSFIGKTSRRVVVREKGKKVKEVPFFMLKNILITSRGVSISSDLVKYCSNEGIPITFFDPYGRPFALVLSPKLPMYSLSLAQTVASSNGKGVHLAKSFAQGKIKNQIHLLKYYRKYKARGEFEFHEQCEKTIEAMDSLLQKVDDTAQGNDLESVRFKIFALEGQSASYYWGLIKLLLSHDVYFEGRERKGATDLVNCLLNYGYGILYSQIYQE